MADFVEREKIQKVISDIYKDADSAVEGACIEIWSRVKEIPAAGVRPVVRGKWMQDCDYHFRCSACGDRWTVSNGIPLDVSNGWNFCPNCGAMMEES